MDELPIGRRVAYWRSRRKLSQQVFADRLGKSKSWVDKVERGVRRLDKLSVVYEIADVLQVDVQVLHGREPERRTDGANGVDPAEVEEIRAALERYDQLSLFLRPPPEAPRLTDMRKAIGHAWLTFQRAKYDSLVRSLPKLLREAQAADAVYAGTGEDDRSAHLLSQVYQIASSVLRKLGEHELAWLAADRAITVAERAGDPLLAGTATCRAGNALLGLDRPRAALEINIDIATRLAPGGGGEPTTPQRLSVYGTLLLQGAMAAAHGGDGATVRDLLYCAGDAAKQVSDHENHYWTCFGPTNVELHRAAAAVELGDAALAVEIHDRLDPVAFAALLPERRANHLLDVARGYAQLGKLDRAGEMLLEADRLAPSEIRCRRLAHEVVTDLLRRARGAPPSTVAELAEQMGVTV